MSNKADEVQPIIIKKVKKGGGGHHGGAWKVAYADFVTAMMAFFLLLWLLNVTTEEEKNAISDYFDPSPIKISESQSGAGGVLGGLSMTTEGAMADMKQPISAPRETGAVEQGEKITQKIGSDNMEAGKADLEDLKKQLEEQENEAFEKAKEEMEETLRGNPELEELAKNLLIDVTPEGLRIQIVDQDGKPMFPSGSADMYEYTRQLLTIVANVIAPMPNQLSIRGHTDAHKYGPGATYTNWELSADRANASRAALLIADIPEPRIANVMGKAAREPLIEDDPLDPQNRRITVLLLRESVEDAMARGAFDVVEEEMPGTSVEVEETGSAIENTGNENEAPEDETSSPANGASHYVPDKNRNYERTPGAVYFP